MLMPTLQEQALIIANGGKVPQGSAKMMIDTGAECTVIDDQIAIQLGLVPIRTRMIIGVSQKPEKRPVYKMGIGIMMANGGKEKKILFQSEVVGAPAKKVNREEVGLLGRDFLSHFRLSYNGPAGIYDVIEPAASTRARDAAEQRQRQANEQKRRAKKKSRRKTTRKSRKSSRK
jgi:predicted aspartyl protease